MFPARVVGIVHFGLRDHPRADAGEARILVLHGLNEAIVIGARPVGVGQSVAQPIHTRRVKVARQPGERVVGQVRLHHVFGEFRGGVHVDGFVARTQRRPERARVIEAYPAGD